MVGDPSSPGASLSISRRGSGKTRANSRRYRRLVLFTLGAVLIITVPAYAVPPGYPDSVYEADPREMAMVPRYCIYSQGFREKVPGGNNPAEIERWGSLMGHVAFHAIHHYCGGLMETNRANFLSHTREERLFYLRHSIVEFDYVIERVPQDFKLLPEILAKKGENLIRLGQAPLGIRELQRAIELRPDYWPPYVELSDYYKGAGDLQKAREYLEKALSYSPDAKGLKRRLTELDAVRDKRKAAPR